jgi:ribosomal protein S18 acetylase RimI-like enzyme
VIEIELLAMRHDATQFQSGNAMLDSYIKRDALKEQVGNIARIFVAVDTETAPDKVLGYFALKTSGFFIPALVGEHGSVPSDTFLHPAEIACLARDMTMRGSGLGNILLTAAFVRIEEASQRVGLPSILLNSTQEGVPLYERFGFMWIDRVDKFLYVPMRKVRERVREIEAMKAEALNAI